MPEWVHDYLKITIMNFSLGKGRVEAVKETNRLESMLTLMKYEEFLTASVSSRVPAARASRSLILD